MTFNLVMLLTIILNASGQTTEQCTRLGDVYDSICPRHRDESTVVLGQGKPGKRGPAGIKGERGEKGGIGVKGSIGEADYDRVEELISERLQEDFCAFTYKGKCFWFEMNDGGVTCERASEICAARGGNPANIYSEYHYYMLLGYLRMFAEKYGVTSAWLGVKYNPKTNVVTLSDGSTATFVKWYPGYPRQSQQSCVYLNARPDPSSRAQNLVNSNYGWARHGVICEI